ncbi:MAG: HD domain-containing phosphohydrolase [Thermodesulfobacteriota bacterium]
MSKKEDFQAENTTSFFKKAFENAINMKEELQYTRKALLYMMQDVNDVAFKIAKARKEWENDFKLIDDMILVVDKDYNILKANNAMSEALGGKPQDIIGTKCFGLFHRTEEPCNNCPHMTTIETEFSAAEEVDGPCFGGTSLVSTYPILDREGKFYASIHVARDITGLKEKAKTEKEFNEKKKKITRSLVELSEALSRTFELEMTIEEAYSIGQRAIGFDFALYYQWHEKKELLIPTVSFGLDGSKKGTFLRKNLRLEDFPPCILDKIVRKEKIITVKKLKDLQDVTNIFDNFHPVSIILIPLRVGEDFLGIMVECYTSSHTFSSLDKEISRGMAHRIALMLDNTRLYEESLNKVTDISKKIETITVMHEIDKTILSTLTRNEVLDNVVRMVSRVVPCDSVVVATVDRYKQGFVKEAGWGDVVIDEFTSFAETSCPEIFKLGKPVILDDLGAESTLLSVEKVLFKKGLKSILRMPLTIRDKVIGVLCLASSKKGAFASDDIPVIENISFQISIALENAWLVEDLKGLLLGTIESLASAIDAKSHWTKGHSERVTEYALMIGKEMGLDGDSLNDLRLVGLLHDVGKIGTYGAILDKPAKLMKKEFEMVKEHPRKGAEILTPIKQFKDIIPAIEYHHESYNGRGYPDGLKGKDIPIMARILCVTDAYDSMTSDRPYRKALGREKAIEELKRCAGTQFDPSIVDAFLKILSKGH